MQHRDVSVEVDADGLIGLGFGPAQLDLVMVVKITPTSASATRDVSLAKRIGTARGKHWKRHGKLTYTKKGHWKKSHWWIINSLNGSANSATSLATATAPIKSWSSATDVRRLASTRCC